MARYLHQVIPIQFLNAQFPYACRYRLEDPLLEKSVKEKGLFQPPIVMPGTPADILSGNKRVAAAKKLGVKEIEVLILQKPINPQEAFLLALISNWSQTLSDLDLAWTVARAVRSFGFSKETVLEQILPAAGKAGDSGFYDEALEVMTLHKTLLDLVAEEKLPFRGAKVLNRFAKPDQEIFASQIAVPAAWTTNQLIKAGDWLLDLLKTSGQSLENYLKDKEFTDILDGKTDRRAKGERLFTLLRARRFPNLAVKEKEFTALSNQIQESQSGVSVEAPPYFESEGYTVRAKIKDSKDLEQLQRLLESKRKVLNSLLDIVL
jgi:hypothetical protein